MAAIDYWCNAFTPDRRPLWQSVLSENSLSVKIREKDGSDDFAEPGEMLKRMDKIGFETFLLPVADIPDGADRFAYERFTTGLDALLELSVAHTGRFAGLWSIDPSLGMEGVRRAAEVLTNESFVGLHLHTHSFDRGFDDRDLYPYYALAADIGVPVVVQAGASGGLMPSACGRPMGIDLPALYFQRVPFVLSHTGWPWVDEALAMAGKHSNVYLGTAAWPPNNWSPELIRFMSGAGRGKVLLGTSFPVVGHYQALERLGGVQLDDDARHDLLEGAARRIFKRLSNEKNEERRTQ